MTSGRRLRRSRPVASMVSDSGHGGAVGVAAGVSRHRARLGWPGAGGQLLLAGLFWVALAAIVYATDPDQSWARASFFLGLLGALFFTLSPILETVSMRFSHSRIYQQAGRAHARRQALELAAFVVLNAILQLVRSWSAVNAFLLFVVFVGFEVIALTRR